MKVVVVCHGHRLTSILFKVMTDQQPGSIDRIFNKLRKDDETHLLFIELFEYIFQTFMVQCKDFGINVPSLLSKRFSSKQTDIGHCKKANYDSIEEYCTPDAAVASVAASGINAIGKTTKPLQLSLFDVSGSSAVNRFLIALDVIDGNKELIIDSGEIQIPLVTIILILAIVETMSIYTM